MRGRLSEGNVRGAWASAGWQGNECGVVIGEGKTIIGFIPADQLDRAIAMLEEPVPGEDAEIKKEQVQLIRDARADIPRLMRQVPNLKAAGKAANN